MSESFLEPLLAALRPLAQCVCVYDATGRCLFANEALARWLARDAADVRGRELGELWPNDFALREASDVRLALEEGRLEREECRPSPTGLRRVRAVKYPWRGRGAVVVVVFEEDTDVDTRSKADQLGQMALGIVHDFNNVLTLLRGQVELLGLTLPEGRSRLVEVGRLLDHATELPRQLLAFARGSEATRQRIDVNVLLRSVEGLLHGRAGRVRFEFRLEAAGACVEADPVQLTQAMLNLCGNALDAMAGEGRLTLETRRVGGWLRVAVEDTGPGIAPEALGRVFEPLFTTRRGGSGVGLAVVREVARKHGGRATCSSELGRGARFVLELPAAEESGCREAVLVLDPAADVARLAGMILEHGGYAAEWRTGFDDTGDMTAEAVVVCSSLLDAEGLRRLEAWLGRNPAARLVVVCTGPEPPLTAAVAARVSAVVGKPYGAEALLRAVGRG